jgi:hypothetical protein
VRDPSLIRRAAATRRTRGWEGWHLDLDLPHDDVVGVLVGGAENQRLLVLLRVDVVHELAQHRTIERLGDDALVECVDVGDTSRCSRPRRETKIRDRRARDPTNSRDGTRPRQCNRIDRPAECRIRCRRRAARRRASPSPGWSRSEVSFLIRLEVTELLHVKDVREGLQVFESKVLERVGGLLAERVAVDEKQHAPKP